MNDDEERQTVFYRRGKPMPPADAVEAILAQAMMESGCDEDCARLAMRLLVAQALAYTLDGTQDLLFHGHHPATFEGRAKARAASNDRTMVNLGAAAMALALAPRPRTLAERVAEMDRIEAEARAGAERDVFRENDPDDIQAAE